MSPAGLTHQLFQGAIQHHRAGRLEEAGHLYRQILKLEPRHADALHLLGLAAHQAGQNEVAVETILQAISLAPNIAEYYSNLGEVYRALGRFDEAVAVCRRAITLQPDCAEAFNNLGVALWGRKEFDESVRACRRALELSPDYPAAYSNLGNALREQGLLDEAVAACRRAVELQPESAEGHHNLGVALTGKDELDAVIAVCRRAIQLKPDYAQAYNTLGNALRRRELLDDSVAACCESIRLQPNYADAHYNLGNAYREQRRLDEAAAAYGRAIQLRNDVADFHNNLGNVYKDQGRIDEAIAAYRQALFLKPDDWQVHGNLIYILHFDPRSDEAAIVREQRRWNQRFGEPLDRFVRPRTADAEPERRLRIGYVSPDFWGHVVGRNILPLLEHHDRDRFEVICYSGVTRPDELTERFRSSTGKWRNTLAVSDEALVETIREDAVDILVDLSQHMAGNRLPVFACRPAPVQVSFGGYPDSSGVEAIKHRISDRYLEGGHLKTEIEKAEKVHFIDSFWCYDCSGLVVGVNSLPAAESGHVTFGCLNNFCKINRELLTLWARVLAKVKDSRLAILSSAGSHRQRVVEFLANKGVAAHRVEFWEPRERKGYLELHHRLDLVLDTFPYNGHTTSLDALSMGVPVVSLAGQMPVARAGLSQLSNLGVPELVAHSEDEYVEISCRLAGDLPRLEELRRTLRTRMEGSVLMDAPSFTHQIERAYREMWRAWCRHPDRTSP